MAMQHTRQAPGRDIHRHFSLAPARSHTITASSKASATAATRNPPPHPDPYKTGPKLAKRRRGHHTCHSPSPPPPPPPPALSHASPHLKPRVSTDGEGRRNSARLCVTAVRRLASNAATATATAVCSLSPSRTPTQAALSLQPQPASRPGTRILGASTGRGSLDPSHTPPPSLALASAPWTTLGHAR